MILSVSKVVSALLIVFVLVVIRYFFFPPFLFRPGINNAIYTVPFTSGYNRGMDVAIEDDGSIHLVRTQEDTVYYHNTVGFDSDWTKPEVISTEGGTAYIQVDDEERTAVVVAKGVSVWNTNKTLKEWSKVSTLLEGKSLKYHALHAQEKGRYLYLVYEYSFKPSGLLDDKRTVFFTMSDDFGVNWTDPLPVGTGERILGVRESPTVFAKGEAIVAMWRSSKNELSGVTSRDHGQSWNELETIKNPETIFEIEATIDPQGIHVFGHSRNIKHWTYRESKVTSSSQIGHSGTLPGFGPFSTSSDGDDGIEMAYVTTKYYTPSLLNVYRELWTMEPPQKRGGQDIILNSLSKSTEHFITPKYSKVYTQGTNLLIRKVNNDVYIFWLGKKPEDSEDESKRTKPEIFYTKISR